MRTDCLLLRTAPAFTEHSHRLALELPQASLGAGGGGGAGSPETHFLPSGTDRGSITGSDIQVKHLQESGWSKGQGQPT